MDQVEQKEEKEKNLTTKWDKFLLLIKTPFATTLITALLSFGGAYLVFVENTKKTSVSFEEVGATNFQRLYDLQSTQIATLTLKNDKQAIQIKDLQNEISEMKLAQFRSGQNSLIFNNSIDSFPFPYWVKTRDGRMVKLNRAFEEIYLEPLGKDKMDYIDKTDFEVWSEEEAIAFRQSDLDVINSKSKKVFIEKVTINGKAFNIWVTKFPIFLNHDVIGVAGFSLPEKTVRDSYKSLMN